jgi:hypothetical protein
MHDTLRDELKKHPHLKGAYLWGNSFLIFSPSEARKHLPPNYAINALRMLAERTGIEHFSAKRFEFEILKPMSALAVWENYEIRVQGDCDTVLSIGKVDWVFDELGEAPGSDKVYRERDHPAWGEL